MILVINIFYGNLVFFVDDTTIAQNISAIILLHSDKERSPQCKGEEEQIALWKCDDKKLSSTPPTVPLALISNKSHYRHILRSLGSVDV